MKVGERKIGMKRFLFLPSHDRNSGIIEST
jgi:hypothetical protein